MVKGATSDGRPFFVGWVWSSLPIKQSESEVRKRLNFSLLYFALTLQLTLSSKGGGCFRK
jgi:hypothetical protein